MILRFYPKKDATIYERYPNKNTGLDAVLDISKTLDGSTPYNSRVLIDFDLDTISDEITNMGHTLGQCDWKLKLFVTDEEEVPLTYNIECYAISQSWNMGIGRYGNIPETTEGVSWRYRKALTDISTKWTTGSFAANTTGSYITTAGGGTWYTSAIATQSFDYKVGDLNIDVSSIIDKAFSGSIDFQGFLLKKTTTDEASASTFRSIKFFSKDTHTVYSPILEVSIDDTSYQTSIPQLDVHDPFTIAITNLRESYSESSVIQFKVSAHPNYVTPTFVTASGVLNNYTLPSGSQYAVYSAHTDDAIINFSNYTSINASESGNYFVLPFQSFQPERYYRFLIRVPNVDCSGYQVYDNHWVFKVSRNQ